MILPWTLSRYIGRHFLWSILLALLGLVAVTLLVDLVELARRAAGRDHVPFRALLEMALLKMPSQAGRLIVFAALIGGMAALARLTRTHELVVVRAAGVSVWQFLLPGCVVSAALGLLFMSVVNPVASAMLLRFEQLEAKYLTGKSSLLSLSSSGLWLRQVEESEGSVSEHIIYALRLSQADMSFSQVVVYAFDRQGRFAERLDAGRAVLEPGLLRFFDVVRSAPGRPPERKAEHQLPTRLQMNQIQDSFASPETMSFWHLPGFIAMLEQAGFSALRHRLHWHSLLASPLLLCGMVLLAAVFSLRLPRRGGIGLLIVTGIVSGFAVHFLTDITHAFGAAGTLPVALASWTPAVALLAAGAAMLLHLEDG